MKTVTQFPLLVVDRFESHGLFRQDFREIEQLAAPLDLAVLADLSNRESRLVLHLREFGRVGAWRGAIDAPRCLSSQRLMAALPVIFLLNGLYWRCCSWRSGCGATASFKVRCIRS